ncbi:MAG: zinc ribbon domain-containing protein [Anaerolineales bacterium]|nr:zinc ribbon domain-containing protein [Anaerolineales bacterium]
MELNSFLMVFAILLLVGLYLYAPFAEKAKKLNVGASHDVSALKAERDQVISSLQELDFDFTLGKVPAEDYPEQRAQLLQRGAKILRQLDELTPTSASSKNAESRIEQAAAAARADSASATTEINDEELDSLLAARRKQHKSKPAGFCPKCGKPVLSADKFCPACGKAVQ